MENNTQTWNDYFDSIGLDRDKIDEVKIDPDSMYAQVPRERALPTLEEINNVIKDLVDRREEELNYIIGDFQRWLHDEYTRMTILNYCVKSSYYMPMLTKINYCKAYINYVKTKYHNFTYAKQPPSSIEKSNKIYSSFKEAVRFRNICVNETPNNYLKILIKERCRLQVFLACTTKNNEGLRYHPHDWVHAYEKFLENEYYPTAYNFTKKERQI